MAADGRRLTRIYPGALVVQSSVAAGGMVGYPEQIRTITQLIAGLWSPFELRLVAVETCAVVCAVGLALWRPEFAASLRRRVWELISRTAQHRIFAVALCAGLVLVLRSAVLPWTEQRCRVCMMSSAICWARDMGRDENRKLVEYLKSRSVWLLEPDRKPVGLVCYDPGGGARVEFSVP